MNISATINKNELVSELENKKIQLIAIINNNGRLVYSNGNYPSIEKNKSEMFLMELALIHRMFSDFELEFGNVEYNITCRKNQKIISIPIHGDNTMLVVAKIDFSEHEVLEFIKHELWKIVDDFDK